jgi:hypothetical protein
LGGIANDGQQGKLTLVGGCCQVYFKRKEHKERRKGPQRQHVETFIFAVLCVIALRFSAVKYFFLMFPADVRQKRNPALIKMWGSIKSIYQTIITRNLPYGKSDHLFIIF